MEFRLDEEQGELQRTVTQFCEQWYPLDRVADREGASIDRKIWRELAGLGVLGLVVPEDRGGVGLGVVDAAIVFEQLGEHLAPGPVLWSLLAAPHVDGVVGGDTVVTGVEASAVVDGEAIVADVDADVVLVLRDDSVEAYPCDPGRTLDALDPLGSAGRVGGLTGGAVVGDADDATRMRRLGTVLGAATMVGIAARASAVAEAHALGRHQFGAPIGSFQAVKHLLADMFVRRSCAQSATYAAAAVLDDAGNDGPGSDGPGSGDPDHAVSTAKVLAADAALENAGTAIQVLGGMGFTWDMLPNHLLKRAWVLENEFGTRDDHEARLGAMLQGAG